MATRRQRAYKVDDKSYEGAMERGRKENFHVANLVEKVVKDYAVGRDIFSKGKRDKTYKKLEQ